MLLNLNVCSDAPFDNLCSKFLSAAVQSEVAMSDCYALNGQGSVQVRCCCLACIKLLGSSQSVYSPKIGHLAFLRGHCAL